MFSTWPASFLQARMEWKQWKRRPPENALFVSIVHFLAVSSFTEKTMRPLRAIGRISYGVYLWHMMVLHALKPHLSAAGFDEHIWLRFAILTLASICVAELSSIDPGRPLIAWGSVFPSRKLCLKSYATGLSSFCQAAGIERPFR